MDDKLTTKQAITVLRNLQDWLYYSSMNGGTSIQREAIDIAIKALEQPEIVYCRYCKHADSVKMGTWCCKGGGGLVSPDFFCGHGERGEERETD